MAIPICLFISMNKSSPLVGCLYISRSPEKSPPIFSSNSSQFCHTRCYDDNKLGMFSSFPHFHVNPLPGLFWKFGCFPCLYNPIALLNRLGLMLERMIKFLDLWTLKKESNLEKSRLLGTRLFLLDIEIGNFQPHRKTALQGTIMEFPIRLQCNELVINPADKS
jgi:hypothetical protein